MEHELTSYFSGVLHIGFGAECVVTIFQTLLYQKKRM